MATAVQKARAVALYRHGLKNILSWAVRREVFFVKAEEFRAEFDKNANLKNPAEVDIALKAGEKWLEEHLHPDPYLIPYQHGSNLYARNPPFPKEIKLQFDFGREGFH